MKIGLFGGSFDPVHLGHLLLAETAREFAGLDEVWFIPAHQSPLKEAHPQATNKQRLEMLRLSVAGYPTFRIYDGELKRQGTSYTIDTVTAITGAHPDKSFSLIIGADSLHDFPRWKSPAEILQLVDIIAVNRGRDNPSLEPVQNALGDAATRRIHLAQMPAVDISATDIRERVGAGRSIRFLTMRAIEQYILQHQLYRPIQP